MPKKERGNAVVARNRRARHDYTKIGRAHV